jgi:sec-independent protein translocase protein TatC
MNWLSKLLSKIFKIREKSDGDIVKPFLEHMEDLRWTLLKMLFTLLAAMIFAFWFRTDLMRILQAPMDKVDPSLSGQLVVTQIAGSFMLSIKMAVYAGIIIAFPFLAFFLADFVLPALTRQEKKYLFPGIAAGFILFSLGVLAAYYYILPETIRFFWHDTQKMKLREMWTWDSYASIFCWLTIGFGMLCEVPVVVVILALLRIVTFKLLASTRPYAITLIFVLSAVIAPTPDPGTLLILAVPVVVLYEACIWIVWFIDRRRKNNDEVADLLS